MYAELENKCLEYMKEITELKAKLAASFIAHAKTANDLDIVISERDNLAVQLVTEKESHEKEINVWIESAASSIKLLESETKRGIEMSMQCLHCGDCCLRMSPVTGNGEPCPHLIKQDTYYFCGVYKNRPEECANHQFYTRFCPIGMDKLQLDSRDSVSIRIDTGWEMIKKLSEENDV